MRTLDLLESVLALLHLLNVNEELSIFSFCDEVLNFFLLLFRATPLTTMSDEGDKRENANRVERVSNLCYRIKRKKSS